MLEPFQTIFLGLMLLFEEVQFYNLVLTPNGTGEVVLSANTQLSDDATLKFYESSGNGTNFTGIKSAASLSSDVTFTLPTADGSNGQFMKTDGSGNLSFGSSSISTANEVSSTGQYYLLIADDADANDGSINGVTYSDNKLEFQPSTGNLTVGGNRTTSTGTVSCDTLSATTISGNVSFSGSPSFTNGIRFQEVIEDMVDVAHSSNSVTMNYNSGNVWYLTNTPSGNMTFNFTNVPTTNGRTTTFTVIVTQGGTGRYPTTVNVNGAGQTIRWQLGLTPTPSANHIDIFTFTLLRRSSSYIVLAAANLEY